MNRPTDVGRLPRPPLALVGRTGPERGPEDSSHGHSGPVGSGPVSSGAENSGAERLHAELQERTADLQRLKAEFDNYRRRVHRDRLAVGQIAVVNVLERLLPVLDALAGAAGQGELTGGFRRIADLLETELAALGLTSFGTVGEPFDPTVHEAMVYTPPGRTGPTAGIATTAITAGTATTAANAATTAGEQAVCTEIIRLGFRVGDRLLRPAQVAVTTEPTG